MVFWDAVHLGAETAARQVGASVYWNAPPRQDDVEEQIALVENVADRKFQGLVLAPDHSLALITPVRRVLSHGIPTVILGSPLAVSPSANLSSVINDDQMGGRLAAERVQTLLEGHGTIAVLGIDPDIAGTMIRSRALEQEIARNSPGITIVEKRVGSFNIPREQQVAEEVLGAHPDLDCVVALMWPTADGVLRSLNSMKTRRPVRVITFDSDGVPSFDQSPNLDSVIQENIRAMSQRAIEIIVSKLNNEPTPALVVLPPREITRQNIDSPEVREMLPVNWQFGDWHWSPIR